jgi:hypothetical protein
MRPVLSVDERRGPHEGAAGYARRISVLTARRLLVHVGEPTVAGIPRECDGLPADGATPEARRNGG